MTTFGTQLKSWRTTRRLSQLDLASDANVSSRHISFLETGRAHPSRPMVMHLCDILEIPKSDRNAVLQSAGFAPLYVKSALEDEHMQAIQSAMSLLLTQHDPFPAIILDKLWCLTALNKAAKTLYGMVGLSQGDSLLDWVKTPGNAASAIENWSEVGHHMLIRLRTESRALGSVAELEDAANVLERDPEIQNFQSGKVLTPVVNTIYQGGGIRLPLMSTFASFGGAEDLAITDLKIELMFPATAEAEAILKSL